MYIQRYLFFRMAKDLLVIVLLLCGGCIKGVASRGVMVMMELAPTDNTNTEITNYEGKIHIVVSGE